MYCENCGAENSDQAKFCIKCGHQLTENEIAGDKPGTARKKAKSKKVFLALLAAILVIAIVCVWPRNVGTEKEPDTSWTEQMVEEQIADADEPQNDMTEPEQEDVPTEENTVSQAAPPVEVEILEATETEADTSEKSTWHEITGEYAITVDTILTAGNGVLWNFNDTIAVGKGIESGIVSTTETDYGFVLQVVDDDTVSVHAYNNSQEDIVPTFALAGTVTGDKIDQFHGMDDTISGYGACPDGYGLVAIQFSTEEILYACIMKENGRIYACNISLDADRAKSTLACRQATQILLDEEGITPERAVYTDPIYYPIVVKNPGEKTDTAYWVEKSSELVEPDWTNAHKIMAIYNYCVDNFAYDYWSIRKGYTSRMEMYQDYTGKYYISQTSIGVCEDFSQVMAIMCRAQGIPAVVDSSNSQKHAWVYAYVSDYNRWMPIDVTNDVKWGVYTEDMTVWSSLRISRYKSLDYIGAYNAENICIGNEADMETAGIPKWE